MPNTVNNPDPSPSRFQPGTTFETIDVEDVQGDILVGLQKNAQRFVFFSIMNRGDFQAWLREEARREIASVEMVHRRETELAARDGVAGTLETSWGAQKPMSALNIAFTHDGLKLLVSSFDGNAPSPAFAQGDAAGIARVCNDPVDPATRRPQWEDGFLNPKAPIHGVLNIAGATREEVDATWERLKTRFAGCIEEVWEDGAVGAVRPGDLRGHEHFGWKDGISQPAVKGLNDPYPGQVEIDPRILLLGAKGGPALTPDHAWMANGSYMVFRKLEQDVKGFRAYLESEGDKQGMDPGFLAARMIGRWPSGAPLALRPLQDDMDLGNDVNRNNDFTFADDQLQRRCPFGAHIRKTNPRADFADAADHRIMRQGIPYGGEYVEGQADAGDRGLLFVCYQADIAQQFEEQQGAWANDPDFVSNASPKKRPGSAEKEVGGTVQPGHDPIIGQPMPPAAPAQPQQQPVGWTAVQAAPAQPAAAAQIVGMDEPWCNYPQGGKVTRTNAPAQRFVTPRAGLYLFAPSISALEGHLANS